MADGLWQSDKKRYRISDAGTKLVEGLLDEGRVN